MKYIKLIFFLLCASNHTFILLPKTQHSSLEKSCVLHELEVENNIHLSKFFIIPILLGSNIIYNFKNFTENIRTYPLSFLTLSCALYIYLADAIIKYKKINHILYLFASLKIMNRYMLYAKIIKNTMQEISKRNNIVFFQSDEEYYQKITSEIPLSFTELETLIANVSQTCSNSLHNFHLTISNDLEDQIYFLCQEHLTTQEILAISQQDEIFYPYLQKFYQNPKENYLTTITKLSILIKKHLQYMLKNQYSCSDSYISKGNL